MVKVRLDAVNLFCHESSITDSAPAIYGHTTIPASRLVVESRQTLSLHFYIGLGEIVTYPQLV